MNKIYNLYKNHELKIVWTGICGLKNCLFEDTLLNYNT